MMHIFHIMMTAKENDNHTKYRFTMISMIGQQL